MFFNVFSILYLGLWSIWSWFLCPVDSGHFFSFASGPFVIEKTILSPTQLSGHFCWKWISHKYKDVFLNSDAQFCFSDICMYPYTKTTQAVPLQYVLKTGIQNLILFLLFKIVWANSGSLHSTYVLGTASQFLLECLLEFR